MLADTEQLARRLLDVYGAPFDELWRVGEPCVGPLQAALGLLRERDPVNA